MSNMMKEKGEEDMDHHDGCSSAGGACHQLEILAKRHDVQHRMTTKSRRNILQPLHLPNFQDDNDNEQDDDNEITSVATKTFHEFARVVCWSKCIPKKELFEAWAMAVYVQEHFPNWTRIADLASGHGLLSWAMLVLADSQQQRQQQQQQQQQQDGGNETETNNYNRSAVCIDQRMPLSADKLQQSMEEKWVHYKGNWDYIEAKLECLQPHPTTLLLGVHCCGILSDRIIDLTLESKCSLALVPCCHSKHCLLQDQTAATNDGNNTNNLQDLFGKESFLNLTDFIDKHRIQRLRNAGFIVVEKEIPKIFTPKNRIILATPPSPPPTPPPTSTLPLEDEPPPNTPKWKTCSALINHPTYITIPVADTPNAKAIVRSLAGRHAAKQRNKKPPTSIVVPLCYGSIDSPYTTPITTNELQTKIVTPLFQIYKEERRQHNKNHLSGGEEKEEEEEEEGNQHGLPIVKAIQKEPILVKNRSRRDGTRIDGGGDAIAKRIQTFEILYDSEYWSDDDNDAEQVDMAMFHVKVCQQIPIVFSPTRGGGGGGGGGGIITVRPLPKKLLRKAAAAKANAKP